MNDIPYILHSPVNSHVSSKVFIQGPLLVDFLRTQIHETIFLLSSYIKSNVERVSNSWVIFSTIFHQLVPLFFQ